MRTSTRIFPLLCIFYDMLWNIYFHDFDDLFSTTTGYDALDQRIALTKDKKEALLLALKFPFLPLHNNDAENGAQHQARLRDIPVANQFA